MPKKLFLFIAFAGLSLLPLSKAAAQNHTAPAPLYRDPVTDGAADPVVIWNREEKSWWMLYTQRRANQETADVAYCYGNPIGIASSKDHGQTWVYRGTLKLDFGKGQNTFWAPDVIFHKGTYHLFVVYIEGVRIHWGGQAQILHYTSKNLWDWKYRGKLNLTPDCIDPTLLQTPDGTWHIWYKNNRSQTMTATSKDLLKWHEKPQPALTGHEHEGAKAFRFAGFYWILTDEWQGMRVHRSTDLENWETQGLILDTPTDRPDDHPSGAHGDVLVEGDKAFVFYFTHPGRSKHNDSPNGPDDIVPFTLRRSSIQVGELVFKDGTLICNRDNFNFFLPDK